MTQRSGSLSTVEISLDGTNWKDISQATYGLDGLDMPEEEGTIETGGGGNRTGNITSGYVTQSASFTCDETTPAREVLLGNSGRTVHVRYRRQGAGSGLPEVKFSGPASISHEMGERDKRRFSVEIMVNGAKTRTTQ